MYAVLSPVQSWHCLFTAFLLSEVHFESATCIFSLCPPSRQEVSSFAEKATLLRPNTADLTALERYAMSLASFERRHSEGSTPGSVASGAVAPRVPHSISSRSSHGAGCDDRPPLLRRTVTTTTTTTFERRSSASEQSEGGAEGVSGSGVASAVAGLIGAAVGMGVGAALTYNSMKDGGARAAPLEHNTRLLPPMSSRGPGSEHSWAEVDRTTEYPNQHRALTEAPQNPHYLADYAFTSAPSIGPSVARSSASARPRTVVSAAQGPLLLTAEEHRSQVGSQYGGSRASDAYRSTAGGDAATRVSTRSRASGATARPPASSQIGSQHSAARSGASRHIADMDSASYVSSRTHRSSAPSRHSGAPAPSVHGSFARSKAGSTASASTMRAPTVVRTAAPSESGRRGSVVSARNVPLPKSTVGSTHSSKWDDLESIAPDDSISCVDLPRSRAGY